MRRGSTVPGMTEPAPSGPLAGIRVIEMGTLIAGPFCGQLLADYGADVIKIEEPTQGDPMRTWKVDPATGASLWWPVIARNKRCVTLNLRSPEGQDLARALIATADIVTENFRPGTLEGWGLGYDRLSADNPGLILVRMSGYGQTGPYASRAGFGAIGEAMGGLRAVTGDPDRAPARAGVSIGDSLAATYGAMGAMAALHHRAQTGRGQVIDSSLYEATLAMMECLVTEYDAAGVIRGRSGSALPKIAPSNVYPCAGGEMILIAANQDAVFARLCTAMGVDWAGDPRFATHIARGERQQELDEMIGAWTAPRDAEAVLQSLHAHGVPAGRIYTAADMVADPHFAAREALVDVRHPAYGTIKMQNVAPKFSQTPGAVRWAGPALGAHNDDVYQGLLGLSPERLDALKAAGVI
jgi:formyl-CoA transferase